MTWSKIKKQQKRKRETILPLKLPIDDQSDCKQSIRSEKKIRKQSIHFVGRKRIETITKKNPTILPLQLDDTESTNSFQPPKPCVQFNLLPFLSSKN